ncbi:MAG: SlyX family protein [Marinibacterium sp.]
MQDLEEKLAYLERIVDDLSETVADQAHRILRLERRVAMLMEREGEREAQGGTVFGDEKPPHY